MRGEPAPEPAGRGRITAGLSSYCLVVWRVISCRVFLARGCGSGRWPLPVNDQWKRPQDRDKSLNNFGALRSPAPLIRLPDLPPPHSAAPLLSSAGGRVWWEGEVGRLKGRGDLGSLVYGLLPRHSRSLFSAVCGWAPRPWPQSWSGLEGGGVGAFLFG